MGAPFLGLVLLLFAPAKCQNSSSFAAVHATAVDEKVPAAERERSYETAVRICPDSPGVYAEFSSFLLARHAPRQALPVIQEGLRVAPGDSQLTLNKAIALYQLGQPQASLKTLLTVSGPPEVQFYRGLDHRMLQDHAAARKSFLDAWQSGYRNPYVLYSLIEEDHALGDKPGGLAHFQWMLDRFPDSDWMHVLLGNAYFEKQQDQQARAEYEKALALNPELPNLNFRLGYLAYQTGDDENAARFFRKELTLNPSHADANLFLGQTLKRMGRIDEALMFLRKAVAFDPQSGLAFRTLAATLTAAHRLPEAVEVLSAAEKRFETDASFPAQRAHILTQLHRNEEARKAAARARQLAAMKHKQEEVPNTR